MCCALPIKERDFLTNFGTCISFSLHETLPVLVFAPLFYFRLSALLFAVLCFSDLGFAFHVFAFNVSALHVFALHVFALHVSALLVSVFALVFVSALVSAFHSSRSTQTFGAVAVEPAATNSTLTRYIKRATNTVLPVIHSILQYAHILLGSGLLPQSHLFSRRTTPLLKQPFNFCNWSSADCTYYFELSRPPSEGEDLSPFVHPQKCRAALQGVR